MGFCTEQEELCELRGSCTVLRERRGAIPLRDSITKYSAELYPNPTLDALNVRITEGAYSLKPTANSQQPKKITPDSNRTNLKRCRFGFCSDFRFGTLESCS